MVVSVLDDIKDFFTNVPKSDFRKVVQEVVQRMRDKDLGSPWF